MSTSVLLAQKMQGKNILGTSYLGLNYFFFFSVLSIKEYT